MLNSLKSSRIRSTVRGLAVLVTLVGVAVAAGAPVFQGLIPGIGGG